MVNPNIPHFMVFYWLEATLVKAELSLIRIIDEVMNEPNSDTLANKTGDFYAQSTAMPFPKVFSTSFRCLTLIPLNVTHLSFRLQNAQPLIFHQGMPHGVHEIFYTWYAT